MKKQYIQIKRNFHNYIWLYNLEERMLIIHEEDSYDVLHCNLLGNYQIKNVLKKDCYLI